MKTKMNTILYKEKLALVNPNLELIGDYINSSTKVQIRCKVCGYTHLVNPYSPLKGIGCPSCSGKLRLNTDTFKAKLSQTNPDLEVLGEYVNTDTPIEVKCKKCGRVFYPTPHNLFKGSGCPGCLGRITTPQKIHSNEEFVQKINNPNITVLGEYVNTKQPIKVKCNICGHEWEPVAGSLLRGYGCPRCAKNKQTKSNEEFQLQLKQHNSNLELLTPYVNNRHKVWVHCKNCGATWEALPNSILGTPHKCNLQYHRTEAQFLDEILKKNPNVELKGKYLSLQSKFDCHCKKCGFTWKSTGKALLNSVNICPKCAGRYKTTEDVQNYLNKYNPNIEVLSEYTKIENKGMFRCTKCENIWETTFNNIVNNLTGCPHCKKSKGEKIIETFLKEEEYSFKPQYKINYMDKTMFVDFCVNLDNQLYFIEYNGIQHYIPQEHFGGELKFQKQQNRDQLLRDYCNLNNIKLLEIPYTEKLKDVPVLVYNFLAK